MARSRIHEAAGAVTDDLWRTAYRLLEQACEQPEADRHGWVQSRAPDIQVRDLVLAMLDEMNQPAEADPPPELPADNSVTLPPGATIGRFRVDRFLGRGGMGHVYAATDVELQRSVALKFFQPGKPGSSSSLESLLPEAQAVSALNHPNIVTLHEVLRTPTESAIVMELVEGQSLRQLTSAPHPVEQVAEWGLQIARGLAAAHEQGIVHRDIKPENLMVRADGLVKILDFGLARKLSPTGSLDDLPIGTLGYMSPEQLRREPLTPATDLFSLGVVLWELAAGRHPFLTGSPRATTSAIEGHDPRFHIAPGPLAKPLERLLRRLLSKDSGARPDAPTSIRLLSDLIGRRQSRRAWSFRAASAGAVVLAGAALWLLLGPGRQPSVSPVVTHFTTYEGNETDPAFSPDGSRLAFAWTGESGHNRNIYVRPLNSEQVTPLTAGDTEAFAPVWSPDSRQIAFLRRSADSSNPTVMIVPAEGGVPRAVGSIANPEGYPRPLAWWPDGKSVLVRDAGVRGVSLTRLDLATGSKQALSNPGGDEADGLPVLSPRGDRFAFVRLRVNAASVCLLELKGSAKCIHTVAQQQGDSINGLIRGLAWRPDGKALYYADKVAIWRLALSPFAKPFKLFDGSFEGLSADPRSARLAFTRTLSESKLWTVLPGNGAAHKLPGSNASEEEPTFSRDGLQLCFRSNRTGAYELWSSAVDGSSARKLTSFRGHLGSPRYSPDGRWIVFDGYGSPIDKTTHTNIYVVPAEGGPVRRLTDDRAEHMVPNWSHDQRWIYYMVARGSSSETWKIPFPSGDAVEVAAYGMFDVWESDDGEFLYYAKRAGAAGIYRRRVSGGEEEALAGTEAVKTIRYWQPGRAGIYFASGPVDANIWLLDWKTNQVREICPAPGRFPRGPRGLAVSPDGSRIVYMSEDLDLGNIDFLEKIE